MSYTCKDCQREFVNYSTYHSHLTRKHKPPAKQCEFCEAMFYSNAELFKHCWLKHRSGQTETVDALPIRPQVEPVAHVGNSLIPVMFR
jgi:hypothetical protein